MGRLSNEKILETRMAAMESELSQLRSVIEFHFAYQDTLSNDKIVRIGNSHPSFRIFKEETTDEDWNGLAVSAVYSVYSQLCAKNDVEPCSRNMFSRFMRTLGWVSESRYINSKSVRIFIRKR